PVFPVGDIIKVREVPANVSIPISLPGLQQGIHSVSSHVGYGQGRNHLSPLRRQTGPPVGRRIYSRYIEEELNRPYVDSFTLGVQSGRHIVSVCAWHNI